MSEHSSVSPLSGLKPPAQDLGENPQQGKPGLRWVGNPTEKQLLILSRNYSLAGATGPSLFPSVSSRNLLSPLALLQEVTDALCRNLELRKT